LRDRAGDRFRIIGIDQQGAAEFDRGASEARQDEDTRIVRILILSGDIFLRNGFMPLIRAKTSLLNGFILVSV
jgi:hypothetical protein